LAALLVNLSDQSFGSSFEAYASKTQEERADTCAEPPYRNIEGEPVVMTRIRDLSLRTKLLSGFGAVLLVTAVMGVVTLVQMNSVKSGGDFIAQNSLPATEYVGAISTDENQYRADQLWNITNNDPRVTSSIDAQLNQDDSSIQASFAKYRPTIVNAQDRALWNETHSEWAAYESATKLLNQPTSNSSQPAVVTLADSSAKTFTTLSNAINRWVTLNKGFATDQQHKNASTYNTAFLIGVILLVLAIVIGLAIALVLSSSIKRSVDLVLDRLTSVKDHSITYIEEGLKAFADGDLTRTYRDDTESIPNPSKDEIGQVGQAVNAIRGKVAEALGAYNQTQAKLNEVVGQISDSATSVSSSSQQLTASSSESGRAAEESGRAAGEIASAIGQIAVGAQRQVETVMQVRTSAEEVGRAIGEVAQSAETQVEAVEQVRSAATEVGRAIADIAHGAETQVQAVESVRASAIEVARSVETAAASARETAAAAHEAREVAQAGVTAAEEASGAMAAVRDSSREVNDVIHELASKSEQIGNIVGTIGNIAQQTNLLALNAAIEAARAGEQGRGFAVVADEVRKLAEESQTAATEIELLIRAIQTQTGHAVDVVSNGAKRTEEGVVVVAQTRDAFERIGDAVDDMTTRVDQIASISEHIAASSQAMQQGIDAVASVAESASASAQEVAASAEEVAASADQVASSAQQTSASAEQVSAAAQQVSASADQVAVSAEEASAATEEVSASAQEVSATTQQTSAAAQQVASAAETLGENAQLLEQLVAQFRVVANEPARK
jgi:methyl-accepting chemotaxis protein